MSHLNLWTDLLVISPNERLLDSRPNILADLERDGLITLTAGRRTATIRLTSALIGFRCLLTSPKRSGD